MAGTYVKLADVYFVENNALGTWAQIGYNGPNGSSGSASSSTNFSYGATTAVLNGSGSATWGAFNVVAMNDCPKVTSGDVWTVTPTVSDGSVTWAASVSTQTCKDLTPNFEKIGK
ncbi:hypothetical protein [Fibrobacter sp.]|uniref:hypothetical protein n=1 Tax=Fibrobacter sp. TaxID=35828 RepID=UPI003890B336